MNSDISEAPFMATVIMLICITIIMAFVGGRYTAFEDIGHRGCVSYRGQTFCIQGQWECDRIYTDKESK
jgi:hypothetical protein